MIRDVGGLPDPDWYLVHVLVHAEPGRGAAITSGPAATWRAWWARQAGERDSPALAAARRQGFVLTSAQTAALGISRSAARTAVRRGRWSVPARGVYAPLRVESDGASVWTLARRRHALAATAAALQHRRHVVSGRSSATLYGLPTLRVPAETELTARHLAWSVRRHATHTFEASLPEDAVTTWFGAGLTTVERTVIDLARHDRRDGIMAADAALRERLATRASLVAELAAATGWPGVRTAREILALASPLAQSPLESLLRLALRDDGFPLPQLQAEIDGYRVDLLLAEQRLIIEADGREKYVADELWREKKRETRLRAAGYRVERVLWSDVVDDWPRTRLRLRAACTP